MSDDEIEERVRDAAGEVERERARAADARASANAAAAAQPSPPPLELVERPPKPRPPELPKSPAELAQRRKKILAAFALLSLLLIGVASYLAFTKSGRARLPAAVRKDVEQTTEKLETAIDEARHPAFYSFTDDEGIVHIVDSIEKVPKKYRARAERKY